MAAKYFAILTNLGAAKLANATALGTQLEITHMAVGDGGGDLPIPNPAQTALISERRRAAINLLTIDPLNNSQIISEQVIPEDVGGWWIREVGLFDKDGSLVAIANCPETYKPQLQEGSGRTQTIRVILIVSSTQSVSLKIDPSVVLATRKYVDDNVIEVKAYADELMRSHKEDKDAHKQYAKIAGAPEELNDLNKISLALSQRPTTDEATRLILDIIDIAIPVGIPFPFGLAELPPSKYGITFLKCNGAAFSAEQFPKLAKVLPSLRLPDLRGEFIRGLDEGRGVDPGRVLMSWQKGSLIPGDDGVAAVNIVGINNVNSYDDWGLDPGTGKTSSCYVGTVAAKEQTNTSLLYTYGVARPRSVAFPIVMRAS
ncbi:phage tail protein [Plesiomonas shigelloides]|uniref:phage tail protein n=1 Tax=Plesiomonas shigelloides TaxID=703 RepID=UPI0012626149|nr:phage tail protein [Plesiomonas shigelloides]KAB7696999.1 phage tail protein [Plesiomonas shigelloides]